MLRLTPLAALALAVALPAVPATAQQADAPLIQLVHDFKDAEVAFDQARLATLVTPDYAEVSPLGELDLHDAFLGFYAADKKVAAPEITIGEPLIRHFGDTASIIVRMSLNVPGPAGQPPRAVAMRVGFLAVRQGGRWKMASAQYTPERPKAPASAK
jgi:ketosteroid isomerase-like protein